jgi:hypothetical protein
MIAHYCLSVAHQLPTKYGMNILKYEVQMQDNWTSYLKITSFITILAPWFHKMFLPSENAVNGVLIKER